MSNERKRLYLSFPQKLQFREWLVGNHKYICDNDLNRDEVAKEATKTLGFLCNPGHLQDIIRTIPELKWPFTDTIGPSGVKQEDIDALKEQMQLIEVGITDINTKIAILQSEYASLSAEMAELRMNIAGRLKAVEDKSTATVNQVNALIGTINGMNQSINMAMDRLGFEKLDKVLSGGLAAVAKKRL